MIGGLQPASAEPFHERIAGTKGVGGLWIGVYFYFYHGFLLRRAAFRTACREHVDNVCLTMAFRDFDYYGPAVLLLRPSFRFGRVSSDCTRNKGWSSMTAKSGVVNAWTVIFYVQGEEEQNYVFLG